MQSTKLWYWEMKIASTGLWRQLSWRMTEEEAEAHAKSSNLQLRKVEASRQELQEINEQ